MTRGKKLDSRLSFQQVVIKKVFARAYVLISNTYLKCWFCFDERRDKNNAPQKERKTTAKTAINLVTSSLIILAKVFVYNPVVLHYKYSKTLIREKKH